MIIKSKPLHPFFFWWGALFVSIFLKSRFNKIILNGIKFKAALYYFSDLSKKVTGNIHYVDGGFNIMGLGVDDE